MREQIKTAVIVGIIAVCACVLLGAAGKAKASEDKPSYSLTIADLDNKLFQATIENRLDSISKKLSKNGVQLSSSGLPASASDKLKKSLSSR